MKDNHVFLEDMGEAIELGRKEGAFVIHSTAPGERDHTNANKWGFWVEKEPGMIRTWEEVVYDPTD